MAREKKFFLPKAMPVWLAIPLTSLMVLVLVALVLTMRNHNRWQDIFFPVVISSVLLLVMVYWLIHIRQVQKTLLEERNLLRTLIDNLPDNIFIKDVFGRIVIDNNAHQRTLGANTLEQVVGKTDFDFFPKELAAQYDADEKQVVQSGEPLIDRVEPVIDKDHNQRWLLTTKVPLRDQQGIITGIVGINRDITERKRAEEAQRKAEEKYRSFFENSIEGIFQTTPEGRFLSANPALAQMLGYDSPEELIASVTDLEQQLYVDPAHRAELKMRLEKEGRVSSFESEVYRKDGSRMWVLKNVLAVGDEDGKPLYFEGTLVDITARKQVEQTQRDAQRTQAAWISELEQRTRQLSLLNEMSDLIQCCPTIEEAYSVISQQAEWVFPQESGALYVLCASRNLAESVAAWGEPLLNPTTFKPTDCWAFRRGQLHGAETELTADHRNKQPVFICSHLQKPTPAAYICVPLIAQGETLGVLHLRHHSEPESYTSETPEVWYTEARRQLAHTIADSLALAISNLKLRDTLRQQSIRDPLTGMFNRRYMEESLDREIARAVRAGRPLGVIMVDIDHFKHYNDMFGHEAGDAVLRELGVFFRSQIREADIACRYGGEEFALIMPDASLEITRRRAEKIREEVKQLQVRHRGRLLGSVTLSLGVAEIPSHGSTGEVLIRIADAALYRAKKAGRDRVVIGKPKKDQGRASNG